MWITDYIVLFDNIVTAFTYLNKDTELFKVVNVPMQDTMKESFQMSGLFFSFFELCDSRTEELAG